MTNDSEINLLKKIDLEDSGWKLMRKHSAQYCSKEFLGRLTKQRETWRKNGIEVGSFGVRHESLNGTSVLETPDLSEIQRKTFCDQCGKRISRIEIEMYHWNRWYKFNIFCHGKTESYEVTEIEYLYMKSHPVLAYCFINPKKQLARDWMDSIIFKEPKRKLIEGN